MELKAGYKQTEVGVIPEDWSISEIIEVASIFGRIGFRGYTKNDIVSKGEGAISLGPSNILDNQLSFEKTTYISWAKYDESPEIKVSEQDVLLVKTGSTGKTCLAKNLLQECTINPQLVILKPKANRIDARLLSALVSAPLVQSQIEETVVGGVLSTLSQREIGSFKLPIPPIEEQQAIAEVLSDVDAEIESLARRHEKLVAQKQGLSEELLSGRIRLVEPKSNDFKQTDVGVVPEDWEVRQLRHLLEIGHGRSQKEVEEESGPYPIYGTGGLMGFATDYLHPGPTVMIGRKGTIDKPRFSEGPVWTVDTLFYCDCKKQLIPRFAFELFQTIDWRSYNEASGVPSLSSKTILSIEVAIPPVDEQQAIAEVLSNVDAEIQAVAKLKAKVQAKKEGLMQTLLTGKIRLT